MPLTLECICLGGGLGACGLTALRFVVINFIQVNVNASVTVALPGGPSITATSTGVNPVDPSLWITDWDTMVTTWAFDRSLLSNAFGFCMAYWYWEADYTCVLSDGTSAVITVTIDTTGSGAEDCNDSAHPNSTGSLSTRLGTGFMFESKPLNGCNGVTISAGGVDPLIATPISDIRTQETPTCLCASGGIPPYTFYLIEGALGSGQSLNETTGCVEGTADGASPQTREITWRVVDSTGETAEVTCNYVFNGCGANPTGVGNWFF